MGGFAVGEPIGQHVPDKIGHWPSILLCCCRKLRAGSRVKPDDKAIGFHRADDGIHRQPATMHRSKNRAQPLDCAQEGGRPSTGDGMGMAGRRDNDSERLQNVA